MVADQQQAHVQGFYALGYCGEVCDTNVSSVVVLQGRLGLWLPHLDESVA